MGNWQIFPNDKQPYYMRPAAICLLLLLFFIKIKTLSTVYLNQLAIGNGQSP